MYIAAVIWLPDLWILVRGEPIRAVGIRMLMHLSIAFIPYHLLEHLASLSASNKPSRFRRSGG